MTMPALKRQESGIDFATLLCVMLNEQPLEEWLELAMRWGQQQGLFLALALRRNGELEFYSSEGEDAASLRPLLQRHVDDEECVSLPEEGLYRAPQLVLLLRDSPLLDDAGEALRREQLQMLATAMAARLQIQRLSGLQLDRQRRVGMTATVIQEIIIDMQKHQLQFAERGSALLDHLLLNLNVELSMLSLSPDEEMRLRKLLEYTAKEFSELFAGTARREQTYQEILSQLASTLRR